MRRALTGCLTAAVLAGGIVAIAHGPDAAADPVPTVGDITWGHDTIATSGTAMAEQSVSLHIVYPRLAPNCTQSAVTGSAPLHFAMMLDSQLRFRITAQPPAVRCFYYRVWETWCGTGMAAASSSKFTITAT